MAHLPANGPYKDLAAHVEWMMVNNGLQFTISSEEDTTSPIHNSEPSLTPPRWMDMMPEPTDIGKPTQEEVTEPTLGLP